MLAKVSSNRLIKLTLISNHITFNKRWFHCFYFKSKLIKNDFKCNKIYIWSERYFCDKDKGTSGPKAIDVNRIRTIKVTEDRLKKPDLVVEKLPKRSEIFELIDKQRNELMEWVAKTPREKKKNMALSGLVKLVRTVCMGIVLFGVFYFFHSETNPLTGRQCLHAIPKPLAQEIESDLFKEIFEKNIKSGSFVPSTDPAVKRLDKCVERIIDSNSDLDLIGDGIWTPVVINDDQICDIIVTKESRNILIYKKLSDLCETEDELAYVVCHELAHVMLDHVQEPVASAPWYYKPWLVFLPQLWMLNRALSENFSNRIDTKFEEVVKNLVRETLTYVPYDEELEEEADRIGMQLMTRSCYDFRKCRQFCKKFRHLSEVKKDSKEKPENETKYEFFTKHQINDNKLLYLFRYIKPFTEIRKRCDCQPLA